MLIGPLDAEVVMVSPTYRVTLIILALASILTGVARAELLVYEPFDYPAGTALIGAEANGLNLTGNYSRFGPTVPSELLASAPGLNYGNLVGAPPAAGNRLNQLSGGGASSASVNVDTDVAIAAGEAIYWSALFTFDDSSNGNRLANITFTDDDTGDILRFGEVAAGVRTIRVEAQTIGTGGQLIAAGASPSFVNGDTLLLVGRYVNSAAADGDRLDLIGYDTADFDMLPLSFEPTDPNAEFAYELENLDINFAKITSITFTIRGDNNNFIDELRIGTTYSAVIPEPAAPLLLLISGCVFGVLRLGRLRQSRERKLSAAADRCL
jgi:hypothetical protein